MANPAPISLTVLALLLSPALLLSTSFPAAQGANEAELGGGKARRSLDYVPVRTVVYRSVALPATTAEASGGGGGGYEPFELCMGCRCCSASNASSCVDTRCCYAIDCNIPGKPFGVCAFSPHTCDCGAANNCTQS